MKSDIDIKSKTVLSETRQDNLFSHLVRVILLHCNNINMICIGIDIKKLSVIVKSSSRIRLEA